MKDINLFQQALNLPSPWVVSASDFNQAEKQLHLHLDFPPGSTFSCSCCAKEGCSVHDTKEMTWRHLNFWQYETLITARRPRTMCAHCGTKVVDVPWARKGSGFSLLFEALIIKLAEDMPVNAIADLVGEKDTRLWRIIRHYVQEEYETLDFSDVTQVGFDETSQKKGHNYITVAVDLEEGTVLHVTEGKDSDTIKRFCEELEKHGGRAENIVDISIDMSPAFIRGAQDYLPDAEVTFDKFHVIKLLNKALDDVRRTEGKYNEVLKGSRYLWLKNQNNLTAKQDRQLQEILGFKRMNLKTVRAYNIKLAFQEFYKQPPDVAENYLKKWYYWATHSQLKPIKNFAATVKDHWSGILEWFTSNVTNGILEGINSLIQEIKSRARGFRNVKNFIAIIYLKLAGLSPLQPT